MTQEDLKELSKDNLQNIILKLQEFLSEDQKQKLQEIINFYTTQGMNKQVTSTEIGMSEKFVKEKMLQIQNWKNQIDEGDLYLEIEEYEEYGGYWDSDWITEYYDTQEIGDKIIDMIAFAQDCVNDKRYLEARNIYEWLWQMCVTTVNEYEEFGDPVDLEILRENNLIDVDMKHLALLTLYTDYQALLPEERANDMYLYFSFSAFSKLHIEDIFHVGRENLKDTDQFWIDWINLLKGKNGDVEARLLKEAILYTRGVNGLYEIAKENASIHPSLYLSVMDEYEKKHAYEKVEEIGENALNDIDVNLKIRSTIALKAAFASSCLNHYDKMIYFCWEGYCSDSTIRNYLRLFGTKEMAERYGLRGKEVLNIREKSNFQNSYRNLELSWNVMSDYEYYSLIFYAGNFKKIKNMSRNPKGSLGWSGSFIHIGIRLILLYLYDGDYPSKAAAKIAEYVGFSDTKNLEDQMNFEMEIQKECREHKISEFWNYFQRWKKYFKIKEIEKKDYLSWAEQIVHKRAEAIVSGQHRNQYEEVAYLLAIVCEIKENMGYQNVKETVYGQYRKKFPRHSAFQREMKYYFNIK